MKSDRSNVKILVLSLIFMATAVAALTAQSAADGFSANANGPVYRVVSDASSTYIAGQQFSSVNGVGKSHLARLNHNGTLDTTYNPNPNSSLQGMTLNGSKLIVVGSFSSIGGGASGGIARLNYDGTNDGTFTASISSAGPLAVEPSGKVLVGGHFTTVGGVPRNRLARFNANGTLDTTFAPNVDDAVFGIAVQPDGKILIAGQFNNVDGQTRWRFARLNNDGTLDNSFQVNAAYPGAGGSTYSLKLQADGKIIVCGGFARFGDANIPRNNIARVNPNGTMDNTFTPNFGAATYDAEIQPDGKIIVGGLFTTLNGATRERIARLNMDGSVDTGFSASANDIILDIASQSDGGILLVGAFTTFNGFANINRIANLYPNGRLNTDTNTTILGAPPSTMVSLPNGLTLIGGGFTSVGGAARQGMARVGWTGANDSSFANPQLTGWVYSIGVQQDGNYIVGGDYTSAGGTSQAKLARITPNGTIDGTFAPTFNSGGWVNAVAIQPDGKILIGGGFTTVNGVTKNRIARLNATGTIDSTFDSSADVYVDTIAIQADGKILIGGAFGNVGGQTRAGIARLNVNGTLDTSFNPILNGIVRELLDIKIDKDGKILIAGAFTGVNGNARTNIARLNADGSFDASFVNPNIDGGVYNIAITVVGDIFVSGSFQNVGGAPHAQIAMLNPDGTVDSAFQNTAASDKILAMTLRDDGKILIGGYFTSIS
ncbi:MAG: delta-60 repeat domain-containing protein, partial [Blastocatellia bacterium]